MIDIATSATSTAFTATVAGGAKNFQNIEQIKFVVHNLIQPVDTMNSGFNAHGLLMEADAFG